jgi:hypothetical protein
MTHQDWLHNTLLPRVTCWLSGGMFVLALGASRDSIWWLAALCLAGAVVAGVAGIRMGDLPTEPDR